MAEAKPQWPEISIADLSEQWDCTPAYIRGLIAKNKLTRTRRGYVTIESADRHRKLRSPAHVERSKVVKALGGQANSKQRKSQMEKSVTAEVDAAEASEDGEEGQAVGNLAVIDGGRSEEPMGPEDALVRARMRDALFKAKDRELTYKQKAGTLIDRDHVKREASQVGRLLVSRLRAFPVRLGGVVAQLDKQSDCVSAIEKEVLLLIQELQEAVSEL